MHTAFLYRMREIDVPGQAAQLTLSTGVAAT